MENSAAQSAIIADRVSLPKSTMLLIVEATELLILVIIKTPAKLKTALIIIALLTLMHRVVTQVAMALGASVQPLTKITPNVKSVVINSAGLLPICCKKEINDVSIF